MNATTFNDAHEDVKINKVHINIKLGVKTVCGIIESYNMEKGHM